MYGSWSFGTERYGTGQHVPEPEGDFRVFIDGLEVGGIIVPFDPWTFSLVDIVEERSILSLDVIDRAGEFRFHKGQQIRVRDRNDALIFAGVIETPDEVPFLRDYKRRHPIRAVDWHVLADRRVVARAYVDTTVHAIVADLHERYLAPEGVTVGQIDAGPVVTMAIFNYLENGVSRAFDAMADASGFTWFISADKRLYFVHHEAFAAPWALTPADALHSTIKAGERAPDYANRWYLRGLRDKTDPLTESFKGDGEATSFHVAFPLAEVPTVEVNETPQAVGIRGIDTDRDWYWNKGDNTISQDSGATPLTSSDTLTVVYVGEFPIVIISGDDDAAAERVQVEGFGTGLAERVRDVGDLEGRQAGFELGARLLEKYGRIGRRLEFTTRRSGLSAGMLLTVQLPETGLDGVEMLITQVETSLVPRTGFSEPRYRVSAIEGPVEGSWAKLFVRKFAAVGPLQFFENIAETEVLTRVFQFSKTWTEEETPNIFTEVFPAEDLLPAADLFPAFAPSVRLTHVEVYDDQAELMVRKQLTSRQGLATEQITTIQYVSPLEAVGEVGDVAWFGGFRASSTPGSGVEVARETLNETKTVAEAWQLERVDTSWRLGS